MSDKKHVYLPSMTTKNGARLCLDCGKSRGRGNHYPRWVGYNPPVPAPQGPAK